MAQIDGKRLGLGPPPNAQPDRRPRRFVPTRRVTQSISQARRWGLTGGLEPLACGGLVVESTNHYLMVSCKRYLRYAFGSSEKLRFQAGDR